MLAKFESPHPESAFVNRPEQVSTEFTICASCGSPIPSGELVCPRCDDEERDAVATEQPDRTGEGHTRAAKVLTVLSAMVGLGWPALGVGLAGYALYRLKSVPELTKSEERWKAVATIFVLLWFFVWALHAYQRQFPPTP